MHEAERAKEAGAADHRGSNGLQLPSRYPLRSSVHGRNFSYV